MGTGGKERTGRDADHSPSYNAAVKKEWELYLLSPQVPPWRVAGQLFNSRTVLRELRTIYDKVYQKLLF
jgi:hypothetical protein